MDFLFPTAVTLSIAVFAWLLLALRLARFRDTLVDRRYNILLAMLAVVLIFFPKGLASALPKRWAER